MEFKSIMKLLGRFFIAYCLIFSNLVYAAPIHPSIPSIPATKSDAFSLASSQLGLSGAFTFGITRDDLLKYSFNASYTHKINEELAVSGLLEYGNNTSRISGTVGFRLLTNELFKVTAERLSQNLPFAFDSGTVNENMSQNALGMSYQHIFDQGIIRDINFTGFYANTPNKLLDPVIFSSGGTNYENYRNIAGGTSKGLEVSSDLLLTKNTVVAGHLYYDSLKYDTINSISAFDTSGVGGGVSVNQLLTDHVKIYGEGNVRKLYDTYKLGVSWLPPVMSKLGVEVSLLGQRTVSHNQTPNSTSVGMQFSLNLDGVSDSKDVKYQVASPNIVNDIKAWTSKPAVRMERVLAIVDQRTVTLVPVVTSLSVNKGSKYGGTPVVITGERFSKATAVKFGTTQATVFTITDDSHITAIAPAGSGAVHITVTSEDGISITSTADLFSYDETPAVSSVVWASGGGYVIISGFGFTGATAVKFGSVDAVSFTVINDTTINAVPPPESALTSNGKKVDVTVTTPNGASSTSSADEFIYDSTPTITSLSVASGPTAGGTSTIITGTNLMSATAVKLGTNAAASFTITDGNHITAVSPVGTPGTVHISITTLSGTTTDSAADQFTYNSLVTVTSVTPNVGPIVGGTSVNIVGTHFTGASAVKFGSVDATSYSVISDTSISAVSPATAAGTVHITVTTPDGGISATSSADEFIYQAIPTVTSITPTAGALGGGASVTITGTGFTGATAVKFGATAATTFLVDSATQITATSPAGSEGTVHITITTSGGISATSSADEFTYEGVPVITEVSPNAGPISGGTTVTITGTDFTGATAVKFGSTDAATFTVNTGRIIAVTAPVSAAGTIDITVTAPGGTSAITAADKFTYAAAPVVTVVSPDCGPLTGGTSVMITGSDFTGTTAVKFGVTEATSFTVDSATQITATSPAESAGTVDITVIAPGGTSAISAADQFLYHDAPTVTGVSPSAGLLTGGTSVIITGIGFLEATSVVKFGVTATTSFTVDSDTQITATSPVAAAAETVDITVTTSCGTSAISAADKFTYQVEPTVTNVAPSVGPLAGDTTVIIMGTDFTGATAVKFGNTAATSFTVDSNTQITAKSPAGTAGTVDITVTTPGGTSAISPQDEFIYQPAPTVTSITPSAGIAGDSVTITGTNFCLSNSADVLAVAFDGIAVSSYAVDCPSNTITGPAPSGPTGTVHVKVTNSGGASTETSADYFTYGVPIVSDVSPNAGMAGTSVTITGSGFQNATGVSFGVTAATPYTINSDTQITVVAPTVPGGTGIVEVTVTNAAGTSVTSSADQFTYGTPNVISVNPKAGAAGQEVTITGEGFLEVTGVKFGNTSASFTIDSAAQIRAIAPSGESGTVDIIVTNAVGSSVTSAADLFTYGAPTVTQIDPIAGTTAGGDTVTITGTGFASDATVEFGTGHSATSVTYVSDTQLTAISPSGTGKVDIIVTTHGGTSETSSADEFIYQDAPTVTEVSPNHGPLAGGTSVTITGTGFLGATGVKFGGTSGTLVTVVSGTQITVTSPAVGVAETVHITVVTPQGTSAMIPSCQFTYQNAPTVTGVSPNHGPLAGGTSVTITGTGFIGATGVSFGGTAGTAVTVVSGTQITATSPAGTGTVHIIVTTSEGENTPESADQFAYQVAPTVTGVSPNHGALAGGTVVTLTGTGFIGATGVSFGGTAGTAVTVVSGTQITATSPAGTGTVDITVITPEGTSSTSSADQFTYQAAPTVTGVSPNHGVIGGGTSVTLTGTGFLGATGVSFGVTPGTAVTVVSGTQITVTSPSGTGTVHITVTTPEGTSVETSADQFAYQGVPTVTGVFPNFGCLIDSTLVTITGTGFLGATGVSFGGTPGTSVTVVSGTQITVNSPIRPAGTVHITVTTPHGTSAETLADQFTYQAEPIVDVVSPQVGPLAGGTSVTITGDSFTGATAVKFGDTAATSFTVDSHTQITATSPAGTAGTVHILVTTPIGTNTPVTADQFTYQAEPTVTSVSPNAGTILGGTSVTITGTGFLTGATVKFDTSQATSVAVVSDTTITCVTPAHETAVAVNVSVTNTDTQTGTLNNGYTYTPSDPTVTAVLPIAGQTLVGTAATITGTGFLTGAIVKFGANTATGVTVVNATTITCTVPAGAAGTVNVSVTNTDNRIGTKVSAYTYQAAPTVTTLSPATGSTGGGTFVTITGTYFSTVGGNPTVTFGGLPAENITRVSATSITCTTPAGAAGAVNAVVTLADTQSSVAKTFTYAASVDPAIDTVAPVAGKLAAGTVVTLNGSGFLTGATVKFGTATPVTPTSISDTQIICAAPSGTAGVKNVSVINPDGRIGTKVDAYTYQPVPTVTSVSLPVGALAGGTNVTITGYNFSDLGAGSTQVSFGGTPADPLYVHRVNSTTITCITPEHAAGLVAVLVTNPDGQTDAANAYTYRVAPTVTLVSPSDGLPTPAGGTPVTITGTGFITGATVTFGGIPATDVTFVSATSITCTTPVHAAGSVDVVVTNTDNQPGPLTNGFTYSASVADPVVTGVSPVAGKTGVGNPVTITGAGFLTGATVKFGTTSADPSFIVVVDPETITCQAPAHAVGVVDVSVTNPDFRVGTMASAYTYQSAPAISEVASPAAGVTAGGTLVTITGTGFSEIGSSPPVTVTFGTGVGASPATEVHVVGPGSITCRTPAHAVGAVAVKVTNADGQYDSRSSTYTYQNPPTVTSLSPAIGNPIGGTYVTITGTNFSTVGGNPTVTFGGALAGNITRVSTTSITCLTPDHIAGDVDVVVTNADTQSGIKVNGFNYSAAAPDPVISTLFPVAGKLTATPGTVVTITGSGFVVGTTPTVKFGTTAATGVAVDSVTQITCNAPAHIAGIVSVSVTNTDGRIGTKTSAYTYQAAPTVTTLSPATGSTLGGTFVRITGTRFSEIGSSPPVTVTFGGVLAENITVLSSTSITCITPAGTAGAVDAVVTIADTQSSAAKTFTYAASADPDVATLSPVAGKLATGTSVTITGSGFLTGATVKFGTAAPVASTGSDTQITCAAPTATAAGVSGGGVVNVTVINTDGRMGTKFSAYTYQPAPTVTSVSLPAGPIAGLVPVTITGTNFSNIGGVVGVTFGGQPATEVVFHDATTIYCTTPAHAVGAVTVVVTNGDGQTGTRSSAYTYRVAPTVTLVSPTDGLPAPAGGTPVTITGTGFITGATVTFGGDPATDVTFVSATSITCTTPAHAAGSVDVVVTNTDNQPGTMTNGFTYSASVADPVVSIVSPVAGETGVGNPVTITGTGFLTGATVKFGTTSAN